MTKDEALKLAQIALENLEHSNFKRRRLDALIAIKQALAQPEQEAVGSVVTYYDSLTHGWFGEPPPEGTLLYIVPPQPEERNFCPRCGKRTADLTTIHTCTPPREST
jgi:hypothetical protein